MLTIVDSIGNTVDLGGGAIIAIVSVILAVTVGFYLLRSFGLYVMAKKQNYKNAYVAWIPFAWIYIAGKLCRADNIFGFKLKHFAVYLTVVFCICEVITLVVSLMQYIPLAGYLLQGAIDDKPVVIGYSLSQTGVGFDKSFISYPLLSGVFASPKIDIPYSDGIISMLNVMNIVSMVLDIFYLVLLFTMYFHLFRTYWPAHYLSGFVFSFFGLFPIFVFALRNKQPVNYNEYVKARYGDYMSRGNGYYRDPYMNNGQNGNPGAQNPPEDPFQEFSDADEPFGEFEQKDARNSNPFEEFDNKKNDGGKD